MEFGKYLYQEKKKEKEGRKRQKSLTKEVRFTIHTSEGDLAFKAGMADKFLAKNYKVRVLMVLKGREKALRAFANERLKKFLSMIQEPHKFENPPKNTPMGIVMIITKNA